MKLLIIVVLLVISFPGH
ncbi:type I toxin-antitoxin system Ibs family toxin [Shigella flexneri]|nr:type I toxin-antitoxin system Ibs family toxin [Shigella flexneri]